MDNLYRLLNLMQRLRDPEQGCPWDRQQTFASILPYTIEEVYEVAEAIDRRDFSQLQDELGDLLLQIVFYAQIASEQDLFAFDDVAKSISDKLVRRHPHVFDDSIEPKHESWEEIKQSERNKKSKMASQSVLDDIPMAMPQLLRAKKIQKRVATVGFDWQEVKQVLEKVKEELNELETVMSTSNQQKKLEEELGDVLFSVVNLSRHLKINAEDALRKCNKKFTQRFQYIESSLADQGKELNNCTLEEMEIAWNEAKQKFT